MLLRLYHRQQADCRTSEVAFLGNLHSCPVPFGAVLKLNVHTPIAPLSPLYMGLIWGRIHAFLVFVFRSRHR